MATKEDLFAYNDGTADVFGDPAAIHRGLMIESDGEMGALHDKAMGGKKPNMTIEEEKEVARAEQRLIEIVRKVFKMAPFSKLDGSGATDTDCIVAWATWLKFMNDFDKPPKA